MIFVFDCSVDELAALPRQGVERLIEELCRSSARGHHRIVIPRTMIDWVLSELQLSSFNRSHLARLRSSFSQNGALLHLDVPKVEISTSPNLLENTGAFRWRIGYDILVHSNFLDRTVMLLENAESDGSLFSQLINFESKRRGFGVNNFQVSNGGGSSISKEFLRIASERYLVLCICDHDRIAPTAKPSDTWIALMEAEKRTEFVGAVLSTPGREAENFLLPTVIREIDAYRTANSLNQVEKILNSQENILPGRCFWLYFDVKEGFVGSKALAKCRDADSIAWLTTVLRVNADEIEKVSIEGLGGGVISNYIASNSAQKQMHSFVRSAYWNTHFCNWFDAILWLTAAENPSAAA